MNNHIQLVLKSSTAEISLNDQAAGIYLVPELDGLVGLPEIRTTSGVNAGYDGGWTSAQNFDARSITIRGVIANRDVAAVERIRKQLISLLAQGKSEQLTLSLVTEAGNAYELEVRTIACDMAMQTVLTQQQFMIQLRADDPLIYDGSASGESVVVQVQQAIGGFEIDFELPLAISGGEGESTIENSGLEQVYPIVKMYGALHNPTFVNLTTNQQIQIDATLSFAEGSWHTPSDVYEGKLIYLENAPDGAPLASFQLDGETSQNGTPTPDAPVPVNTTTGENVVKITGKNLFTPPASASPSGITYTLGNDGTYTIYGTATAQADCSTFIDINTISNGETYTLSANKALPSDMRVLAEVYNGSTWVRHLLGSDGVLTPSRQTASGTANTSGGTRIKLTLRANSGSNINISGFGVQLELGSATAYEPYQGQSYEVNLGKNLLEPKLPTTTKNGITLTNNNDGSFTLNGTATSAADFRLNQSSAGGSDNLQSYNGTYTLSCDELQSGVQLVVMQSGTWQILLRMQNNNTPVTATFDKNKCFTYVYVAQGTTLNNLTIHPQLEKGSQATSYAAYFTPIELCKIGDYQDCIYKSGGKWYVRKECGKSTRDVTIAAIASDNTSGADKVSADGAFLMFSGDWGSDYATTAGVARLSANVGTYKLDASITGNTGARAMESGTFCQRQGTNDCIYFRNTAFIGKTGNEVKSLLAQSGGTNLWYPLSTPTDTEITNEALITQLDALLTTARTYAGINNISVTTQNEQPTLELSYMTQKEDDRRDVVEIDSRLRTVTLNGTDIYHLIGEGSEFPMLAPGENKLLLRSDIPGDNGYAEVNYKQGYLSI